MKTKPLLIAVVLLGLLGALGMAGWMLNTRSLPTPPLDNDKVKVALSKGKPTVIEFGSTNCAGCKEMKPILQNLALTYGERIVVSDIDILKETTYIQRYQIKLMPTQVFYDAQGRELSRHMGKINATEMVSRLGLAPLTP